MAKRKFLIEFEADDHHGILLPVAHETVKVSVKPEGEEHWSEMSGIVSFELNIGTDNHRNRFSMKLIDVREYEEVDIPLGRIT